MSSIFIFFFFQTDCATLSYSTIISGTFTLSHATFIVLILKKVGALKFKNFWQICLINSGVCKIISKVLTNHMSMVMEKIIFKSQNTFVKGRQILDSVLIANKCLHSRLKSGVPRIFIKLDVENTFDHVSWGFLLYLFGKYGFGQK